MVDKKTEDNKDKGDNDKFILIDLNDEKAGHIAEVLKNKTSKKILDYLGDVREASEKDIADALGIAINTIEYNLKKLIKAGFVKKTGNFLWSVKGKKIPMYKLARKHVVISPGNKPNINFLKTILPVILIAVVLIAIVAVMLSDNIIEDEDSIEMKKFSSLSELKEYVKANTESSGFFGEVFGGLRSTTQASEGAMMESGSNDAVASKAGGEGASDYSETNIQVEGVDEADIVKNDGKYIYVVSGNKVLIVDAYPAEGMEILSEIKFNEKSYINEIFVNKDKLVLFSYGYEVYDSEVKCLVGRCGGYGAQKTLVSVYDISDRKNPELEKEFSAEGNYRDSRMIGDYVYVVSTKYVNRDNPELPVFYEDGIREDYPVTDLYYPGYSDTNFVFSSIIAINLDNYDFDKQVYLTGSTNGLYVSEKNIYLTNQKYLNINDYFDDMVREVYYEILPNDKEEEIEDILDSEKQYWDKQNKIDSIIKDYSNSLKGEEKSKFDEKLLEAFQEYQVKLSKEQYKTAVYKISLNGIKINYKGVGEVPGYILNQFSMDEYKGNFRIATTTGQTGGGVSLNHLYVLNEDLEIIGSVEDLAKGERIYSTRFIGNRAYMVTFRQTDPLYVIDLSNPKNPEVLGYLKITGFSDYLHPYDENYLIGVGMEATEQGRVQGVKIALFDVSDVENPKEVSKYEVGKEWSDVYRSYSSTDVSYDHKAFLFDKEKQLLIIPVSYTKYLDNNWNSYEYWQGAYVFNLNLEEGFRLRGKITHFEGNKTWQGYVQRSLYMDDVLYTISNYKIKANDLFNLDKISELQILEEDEYP
ncbi:MAG: beta-propeller domain-containing protein, partial [archaeon]